MNRAALIVFLVCFSGFARAESDAPAGDSENERQENMLDQEWEAQGVIPEGGLTVSTQPVTPIAALASRKPYDAALEELALARDLWKNGKAQAASDVSLQSYDDLMRMRLSRRNKKQRQKLRQDRHDAATVYTDSSIAYIQEYVKKNGGGPAAIQEGLARLGDLHDVAQNYPELTKKLYAAMEAYEPKTEVKVSSPTAAAAPASTTVSSATVAVSTPTKKN